MKKKSFSLSILLLKSFSTNDLAATLNDRDKLESHNFDISGVSVWLYYKQNPTHPPAWVKLFTPVAGDNLKRLYNSGTAAVLFVPCSDRVFALTFGYGRFMLLPESYEENFGLRVVLNSVNPDKLRSVDAQSLEAVPVSRRTQASVATSLADFGLNIEQDLIYAATGEPKDTTLGRQITGKDALKISVPIILEDLPVLLGKLFNLYESCDYQERFKWIDNLMEVRDRKILADLDNALGKKIGEEDFSKTWLAVPEIVEWVDSGGFRYQPQKNGSTLEDISWTSFLIHIGASTPKTADTFHKYSVSHVSESSGHDLGHWSIYHCIYCELKLDNNTFALNNGKWYRVNADFLTELNTAVNAIPHSKLSLPSYNDKDEKTYNKRVCESNSSYFALMDEKMIRYGGGSSQIEFCDLYTSDKQLLHVKRYGGSSVLSHLFSQGFVSAQLLLSDGDFRAKVNEELPLSHRLPDPANMPQSSDFEVVYAIVSNDKAGSLDLPLFSKINLRNSYKRLQLMGLRVSVKMIPVISSAHKEETSS
jgi:uncharacterized protein (TIGR04141 family)